MFITLARNLTLSLAESFADDGIKLFLFLTRISTSHVDLFDRRCQLYSTFDFALHRSWGGQPSQQRLIDAAPSAALRVSFDGKPVPDVEGIQDGQQPPQMDVGVLEDHDPGATASFAAGCISDLPCFIIIGSTAFVA